MRFIYAYNSEVAYFFGPPCYLQRMVRCVFQCAIWAFRWDDDESWSGTPDPADQAPYCAGMERCTFKWQSSKSKRHIADLDDVSTCVRLRQSAHDHVRVSNRLHLTTNARHPIKQIHLNR